MSGWEPVVVTRYERDEAGRVVASVTEREPEWSRADVESLIAFREAQRVGSHGHEMSVAVDPLGDPSNPDREWDWVVPLPVRDFAQEALDSEKKRYAEAYPDAEMGSLKWRVEKRPSSTQP